MKFDGQRYATNEIDDPIVDPILERGDPKAQLCRGFQNMKFDGQLMGKGTPPMKNVCLGAGVEKCIK